MPHQLAARPEDRTTSLNSIIININNFFSGQTEPLLIHYVHCFWFLADEGVTGGVQGVLQGHPAVKTVWTNYEGGLKWSHLRVVVAFVLFSPPRNNNNNYNNVIIILIIKVRAL